VATQPTPAIGADNRQWLSLGLARTLLGVNEATLRQWADHGLVRAFRTPGGHRRFSLEDIQALVQGAGARPNERVGPEGAAVLPRIRRRVDEARPAPPRWMTSFDDVGQQRMRTLGRQLLELCMDTVHAPERRDLVKAATALGHEYGVEIAGRGVALPEAVEGFVFFRHITVDAIKPALQQSGGQPAVVSRVWQQLGRLTDEVLLGLTRAYGPMGGSRRAMRR
jgi:excisionase family DNA binding protein